MAAAQTTRLDASEAWREIAERQISLVPALGVWVASVDEFGSSVASKRRKVRTISATASTPLQAVRDLCARLDAMATPQELFGRYDSGGNDNQ